MTKSFKKTAVLLAAASIVILTACTSNEGKHETVKAIKMDKTNSYSYAIVDTNQTKFYDDTQEIEPVSSSDENFYGQDANFDGFQPNYTVSSDGKVVFDNVSGLTWMRGPNTDLDTPEKEDKMSFDEAKNYVKKVNAMNYGGYNDWRIPSAKELYSLIQFTGTDPDPTAEADISKLHPFIDTEAFNFAYGETDKRERIIDSQYLTTNAYIANGESLEDKLYFGVNFADGRIKGYEALMPFDHSVDKTFFVQLVRGNEKYGINDFIDNGDGTITDRATGLMWSQNDSKEGMTWKDALAWVQEKNNKNYLGHNDWRLPNIKELQSLTDYENAPDYNGKPAIDTDFFICTTIINEEYKEDYPWYWSGTTHASVTGDGSNGCYVPMGRAMGYENGWLDVHGAGAQRSDPKSEDYFSKLTKIDNGYYYGDAPQGDANRIYNFVRLVRDMD